MQRAKTTSPAKLHRLLSPLATPDPAEPLLSGLETFEARRGSQLLEAGKTTPTVWFVTEGLVAICGRGSKGACAEVGLVGPGGLVGHTVLLGPQTPHSAVALTTLRGVAMGADVLRRAADELPAFRRGLLFYALERSAETEAIAVCAALHSVEQRLARWLGAAAALQGGRAIDITHEQFAGLFGVRRASVTTSLHMLEGEQAVRCRRGRIEIRDARRLEALSCGCRRALAQPDGDDVQDAWPST